MARYSVNNYTVETLLASIKAGSVAIPEMQRPFVWDGSKVRDLIDSLYKGFPVGYIIVWQNQAKANERFWQQNVTAQPIVTWRGYAFENVCFCHVDQIKRALGISGVSTSSSAWSKKGGDEDGTQIDLLLMRNDHVINMCEIKFTSEEFTVDKAYYRILLARPDRIKEAVSPKMSVHSTLITVFGLKRNEYCSVFTNVITLDDLFS